MANGTDRYYAKDADMPIDTNVEEALERIYERDHDLAIVLDRLYTYCRAADEIAHQFADMLAKMKPMIENNPMFAMFNKKK